MSTPEDFGPEGATLSELRDMLKEIDKDLGSERVLAQVEVKGETLVYDVIDVRFDDGMIILDLEPAKL